MSSKSSMLFLGLLIGAASVPASFAAANAPDNRSATAAQQTAAATAQKKKAAALRKKKQQQQAAAAAKARQAKALEAKQLQQQQAKKKEWYADDRDRGLDIAAKSAPKTIARVRARQYIAKGDTVRTGKGKTGWQHYMDRYYSR
jgi:hypothetical protein